MSGAFTHRFGLSGGGGGGGPPGGGFGSHQAWMLEIDENNGHSSATEIVGLIFRDSGGNVIPTTGGTAFSGGSGTDTVAISGAFDANSATRWQRGAATNTKLGYIFSSAVEVATIDIEVFGSAPSLSPKKGRLRSSDDTTTGLDGTYATAFEFWEPCWPTSGSNVTRSWPQDFALGTLFKELWFTVGPGDNGNRFPALNELEYRATVGGSDFSSTGVHRINFPGSNEGFAFDDNNSSVLFFDTLQSPWPGSLITAFPTPVALAQIQMYSNNDNSRIPRDIKVVGKWLDAAGTIQSVDLITQTGISGTIPFTQTYNV